MQCTMNFTVKCSSMTHMLMWPWVTSSIRTLWWCRSFGQCGGECRGSRAWRPCSSHIDTAAESLWETNTQSKDTDSKLVSYRKSHLAQCQRSGDRWPCCPTGPRSGGQWCGAHTWWMCSRHSAAWWHTTGARGGRERRERERGGRECSVNKMNLTVVLKNWQPLETDPHPPSWGASALISIKSLANYSLLTSNPKTISTEAPRVLRLFQDCRMKKMSNVARRRRRMTARRWNFSVMMGLLSIWTGGQTFLWTTTSITHYNSLT